MLHLSSHRIAFTTLVGCSLISFSACDPIARKEPTQERPRSASSPAPKATLSGSSPVAPPNSQQPIPFVENGEAVGVFILSANASPSLRAQADYFAQMIERSTGVAIPIISQAEADALPSAVSRVYIGPSPEATAAGVIQSALPAEGYRILTKGNAVYILGTDATAPAESPDPISRPTRWAINDLLERTIGVRWLWPGDLGTYVPKQASFSIPPIDRTYQPVLLQRRVRIPTATPYLIASNTEQENQRLTRESIDWAENHQSGSRGRISFGHAFGKWWERYGETNPDLFAQPPPGITNPPYDMPKRIKLRLANPAVIEQIAKEYEAVGKPEYYNVCPNDGSGFDLSPETRAWDIPRNLNPDDIWNSRADLTPRFVMFWNRLHERLQQINPDVKLTTYAYYSYKKPPPEERPLVAKTIIGLVCGYRDFALWEGWANQPGTRGIYLRPNWGHLAANAPYLPLKDMEKFMNFGWEKKMMGFDLDSIMGYWATQGLNYYLWARMMSQPGLTTEQLLDEYTSAFGNGAPKIRAYFDYWQARTDEFDYPEVYSDSNTTTENGRYAQLIREGKTKLNFILGPRWAMPYLYTDDVLQPAYRLLDEASAMIGETDREARDRVEFLRAGLDELVATRDVIALGREIKKESASPEELRGLQQKVADLDRLREKLTPSHAIWGGAVRRNEIRYRMFYRPEALGLPSLNLDGM